MTLLRAPFLMFMTVLFGLPAVHKQTKVSNLADSVANLGYIKNQIYYTSPYDFIRYDINYLEWKNPTAIEPLFIALKNSQLRKVRIVHIGDSHVQADIFTGTIRNRMQDAFGVGGRGMIFPYACAKTHAAYDYQTSEYGAWESTKNIVLVPTLDLGLSGATIRTTQPGSGFKVYFNNFAYPVENRILKIYCKKHVGSYDLQVKYATGEEPIILSVSADTTLPYIALVLPKRLEFLDVSVLKRTQDQSSFELYGVALETLPNTGVVYNSVGINGAAFSSILKQTLMPEQLKEMKPDAVVLDIAGNEYFSSGLKPEDFETKMRATIKMIREGAPNATIIVSCSQDMFRYGYNLADCKPAADLARKIAFDMNCVFYNYYEVAGGQYVMQKWLNNQLANYDRVHLTYKGYVIKGELFFSAMMRSYYHLLTGKITSPTLADSLPLGVFKPNDGKVPTAVVVNESPLKGIGTPVQNNGYAPAPVNPTPAPTYTPPQPTVKAGAKKIIYTVKQGDNLGFIAQNHKVGVNEIMAWNGLGSTLIKVGQQLVIYVDPGFTPTSGGITAPIPPKPVASTGGKVVHTVVNGESLWTIANKYKTTVDAIKKLNGLKTDKLSIGQKLVVK